MHKKFYANEFTLEEFLYKLIGVTICDSSGIVVVGGVRPILEIVAITNKEKPVRSRLGALQHLLNACNNMARTYEFDQLHAFIQDDIWLEQLRKRGFRPTIGKSLVRDVTGE